MSLMVARFCDDFGVLEIFLTMRLILLFLRLRHLLIFCLQQMNAIFLSINKNPIVEHTMISVLLVADREEEDCELGDADIAWFWKHC